MRNWFVSVNSSVRSKFSTRRRETHEVLYFYGRANRECKKKIYCQGIGHFTVVYTVTRPMNGSEAADDLVLIDTDLTVFIM